MTELAVSQPQISFVLEFVARGQKERENAGGWELGGGGGMAT